MADITYSNVATERRASPGVTPGKGEAHNVKVLACATIELAASASGTTVKFGRIPSNARILSQGVIYNDDLATSGSPTLDVGLASVDSNITSAPTALTNGFHRAAIQPGQQKQHDDCPTHGKHAKELIGHGTQNGVERREIP